MDMGQFAVLHLGSSLSDKKLYLGGHLHLPWTSLATYMAPTCCRAQASPSLYPQTFGDLKDPKKLFIVPGDPKLLGRFAEVTANRGDCQGCSLSLWVSKAGSSSATPQGSLTCSFQWPWGQPAVVDLFQPRSVPSIWQQRLLPPPPLLLAWN